MIFSPLAHFSTIDKVSKTGTFSHAKLFHIIDKSFFLSE